MKAGQHSLRLGAVTEVELLAGPAGRTRDSGGHRADLAGADPTRLPRHHPAAHRAEDEPEDPLLGGGFGGEHPAHHQHGGLLHADQATAGDGHGRRVTDDDLVGPAGAQVGQGRAGHGHVCRRQSGEGILPVVRVDLPQSLAGPPAADRRDDVVDAAEMLLGLGGQVLGPGEGGVVVHHQMQPGGRGVAEHLTELLCPRLPAGGDHDIGPGVEIGAHDALTHGSRTAGDDDPAPGQEIVAGHETTPSIKCWSNQRW